VTRAVTSLLVIWLACASLPVRADDADSVHRMVKANGELDVEKCGVCHNDDMSLQRSKLETCTLCHSQTLHAGSDEHVRAEALAVKRVLEGQPDEAAALPLGDEGHIYCGTCHLFHDPAVLEESWLEQGWVPRSGGLAGATRQSVIDRWAAMAKRAGEKSALGTFATAGTKQLRLPVDEGQLCRRCHGAVQ
jgi:hypothetical protein